jgi:hypothetical protein
MPPSPGVMFLNNTVVTEASGAMAANLHWRNNLILGSNALAAVFSMNTNTTYSSSDHNGFTAGAFAWNTPPPGAARIDAQNAKLDTHQYKTFAEYQQGSGQDAHSLTIDYDIFMKVPKLDAKDLATVQRLYKGEDLDFRLKAGSAAIDRGVELPTITDGFSGKAPDLGALEFGKPAIVYGPRK